MTATPTQTATTLAATNTASGTSIRVGFQGHNGAHSEDVAAHLFKSVRALNKHQSPIQTVGYDTFEKVFQAVVNREIDYAVVPIENSATGTFYSVLELLDQYARHKTGSVQLRDVGVHVVGECVRRDVNVVMALPGVTMQDVTEIRSHPSIVDQCQKYLHRMGKQVTIGVSNDADGVVMDTAINAGLIRKHQLKHVAAIGSESAAKIHGLAILDREVEDDSVNLTRYVVVARRDVDAGSGVSRDMNPRTMVSVRVKNVPGMFFKILAAFSMRDVNVCKVESRPTRRCGVDGMAGKPWEYVLYVDVDGSVGEASVCHAVKQLEEIGGVDGSVRVLGSFPRFTETKMDAPQGVYGIGM